MPRCIGCGCTEERACLGGCSWISVNPPKCSACFDADGEPFAVGDRDEGRFGFERCPASDVPMPHVPLFAGEATCYCARCKIELAA